MTRRREFIAGLGGTAAGWPIAARAQQPNRVRRIGALMTDDENDPEPKVWLSAFTQGLHDLGWTDGNNMRMDVRWAAGDINRMRTFAKELADLQPYVILANTTLAIAALQRETRTIPIVFAGISEPGRQWLRCRPPSPGREYHRLHQHGSVNWGASGCNCSPRSRPTSSELQPYSILTQRPVAEHITCPHSRPPPDHSRWRRSRHLFIATPKSKRS